VLPAEIIRVIQSRMMNRRDMRHLWGRG
jgi:hypothetical protein